MSLLNFLGEFLECFGKVDVCHSGQTFIRSPIGVVSPDILKSCPIAWFRIITNSIRKAKTTEWIVIRLNRSKLYPGLELKANGTDDEVD
jgi:hypothetical protein